MKTLRASSIAVMVAALAMGVGGCAKNKTTTASAGAPRTQNGPNGWDTGRPNQDTAPVLTHIEKVDNKPADPAPKPATSGSCRPTVPSGWGVSSLAYPTGDASTSAVVVHEVIPQQVRVNQPFAFELHVCNLTSNTLQNVIVYGDSAQNMTIESSAPAATRGNSGGLQWVLGDLAPHATEVIKVNGRVTKAGQASNCVSISYANVLCAGTTAVEPALTVTKAATPEVMLCDTIQLRYEVKNAGSGPCDTVVIRDTLPAGLTVDGKSTVEIAAGTLAAGQSKPFTVNAKATKTGTYESNATATGCGLTAESNRAATVVKQPVLAIKVECPGPMLIGRSATFSYTVTNTGNGNAANTTLVATVPGGSQFVSADNGGASGANGVTWNLGSLAPNASRTVTMTARSTGAGTLTTNATANAVCAAAVSGNCGTPVQGVPDMGTMLTDRDGVVLVGDNHTYIYEVENQGQVDLTNVSVVVTLPEGMEFVSSSSNIKPVISGRTLTFTATEVLKAGEKRSATLVVKVAKSGEYLVVSETTAKEMRSSVRDDEVTMFVDR